MSKLLCGKCNKKGKIIEKDNFFQCECCNALNKVVCHEKKNYDSNMSLREWVDFDYNEYLDDVIDVTKIDNFADLKAITKTQLSAGLLNAKDVDMLRTTMLEAFEKNWSIKQIESTLKKRIEFKDRFRMKDGKIIITKNGKAAIGQPANKRAIAIARTETVRLSNLGAFSSYKKAGILKVKWIAAFSDRTCTSCSSLNGVVFDINKAPMPPLHTYCRCTTGVVLE